MVAQTRQRGPSLVGILNITEDSFSDGGAYLSVENALAHARRLLTDGADFVELGPSSSHPDSKRVTAKEEIARLEPVVSELMREGIPFAVDTFETETQRWSLRQGASILNDIQGFPDESLWPELANASCDLVVMHSIQDRGPATRESFDEERIVDRVLRFFDERFAALEQAGVKRSRLIADPGMGFFLGSNPEPSVAVLRGLDRIRCATGARLLVSVSRKSFLGALCAEAETQLPRDVAERLPSTLTAELYAARKGVDMIRTHEVRPLADALRTALALEGGAFFDGESAGSGDADLVD